MYFTVYKITNNINNKVYIGVHKTNNLEDGYMGSGKYLSLSIKKYGSHNFSKEILFVYDNPVEMYQKEAELVDENFIAEGNTYNLRVGGSGGFDYINQTKKNIYGKNGENGKKYIDKANKVLRQKLKDKNFKKEYLKSISKSLKKHYVENGSHWLGKKHSDRTKKIISEKNSINQKGNKNSQYNTEWITDGTKNLKIKKGSKYPEGFYKGRS
jgi:hypothetical protein